MADLLATSVSLLLVAALLMGAWWAYRIIDQQPADEQSKAIELHAAGHCGDDCPYCGIGDGGM